MFDVGGGIGVIQVDGGEAKSIQETVGGASGRLFEAVDAEFDADGRLFVEGSQSVKMIIQNDRSGHTSQAKHLYRLVLTPLESWRRVRGQRRARSRVERREKEKGENRLAEFDHLLADVGHEGEGSSDVFFGDTLFGLVEEFDGCLVDDVHHGGGISKKEGHPVCKFVADADVEILFGELETVEGAAIVRKIVLDGRISHLLSPTPHRFNIKGQESVLLFPFSFCSV